jgi:large subunit ribosomal protein L24
MNKVFHIKKGDTVFVLSGKQRKSTGKVLAVDQGSGLVQVEGIGVFVKNEKPSQKNPKGGRIEKNRWMPACKFVVVTGGKKDEAKKGKATRSSGA